jgi:hypothetical protein
MPDEAEPQSLYRRLRPIRIVVALLLPFALLAFDRVNGYFRTRDEDQKRVKELIADLRDSRKGVPESGDLRSLADQARSVGAAEVWAGRSFALGSASQLLLIELPRDPATRKRLFDLQGTKPCLGRPEPDEGQLYLCLRERNLKP